ncbi:hypothetical protein BDFB_012302, partial [Asbolus verrucosus]
MERRDASFSGAADIIEYYERVIKTRCAVLRVQTKPAERQKLPQETERKKEHDGQFEYAPNHVKVGRPRVKNQA